MRLLMLIVLGCLTTNVQAQCANGSCSPRNRVFNTQPIYQPSVASNCSGCFQPNTVNYMPTYSTVVASCSPETACYPVQSYQPREVIISERVITQTATSKPTEQCQCDVGGTPCKCDPCKCGDQKLISSQEKPKARITIYTNDPCMHCDQWKQSELPKYQSKGWDVQIISGYTSGVVPRFKIEYKGYIMIHEGFMTVPKFKELISLTN